MTVTARFTIRLGTFEYLGCPGATHDARERVLMKLRDIEDIDIGFGYMLDDENETLGVRLTVRGEIDKAAAIKAIGDSQRSARFWSCIVDSSNFEEIGAFPCA